jgi:hypothetical protein
MRYRTAQAGGNAASTFDPPMIVFFWALKLSRWLSRARTAARAQYIRLAASEHAGSYTPSLLPLASSTRGVRRRWC